MGNLCSSTKIKNRHAKKHDGESLKPCKGKNTFSNGLEIDFVGPNESQLDVVSNLPPSSKKVKVHSVYDGDTITVVHDNGYIQRVRLIGIDTPELDPDEPFAKKASDFLKENCPLGSEIWLVTSSSLDKCYDKYNRLLAYIYVKNPMCALNFICLNVSLVYRGLAFFYAPKGSNLLDKRDLLLSAQNLAIKARRNLWSIDYLQRVVYTTQNGISFHRHNCRYLKKMWETTEVEKAALKGLSPCRCCHPLS